MQMYSLPVGGAVVVGEVEVSPVTLYTKQHFAHKHCFIRHYIQDETNIFEDCQFPSEIQWYKTPTPGLDFETCNTQPCILSTWEPFEFP